jgi:phage shock protein PspC (stress-responsive transcriptional regulator)
MSYPLHFVLIVLYISAIAAGFVAYIIWLCLNAYKRKQSA